MTAERVWIDARGGGFGHAMRGARLAALLAAEGHLPIVCVRPGSERYLGRVLEAGAPAFEVRAHDGLPSRREAMDTLIVDTFPEGARGEWTADALRPYARRVLCARFRRDGLPPAAARYDEVWLPYCEAHDEWRGAQRGARYLGLVAGPSPLRVDPGGETLCVFDPGGRLDPGLRDVLARLAREAGRPLVFHAALEGRVEAAKVLVIGAGYNTVYELLREPMDVRFLPLARRFDDQARRARLLGRAADTLEALRDWLRAPTALGQLAKDGYADARSARPVLEAA